jgi:tetratricopeptide (TPR) repeat protein
MHQVNGSNGPSGSPSSALAELVDRLTAQLQSGVAVDWEAVERQHPEHADELRRLRPALGALDQLSRSGEEHLSGVASAPAADAEPLTGLLGDYRILRELGRGGMGVVYEAEQVSLGRKVALKVLPLAATLDPRRLQRFVNEARAAAGLHHPGIVPVHAVGCERGVHYYAMQYIDGQTLAAVLAELRARVGGGAAPPADEEQGEPTTAYADPPGAAAAASTAPQGALSTEGGIGNREYVRAVARLGVQAAEALDYAHQLGVVHRDVKPANLMVDGRGQLWVTDFGLALFQREGVESLTLTGDLVGTLRYMSPEQALAKRVVIDHRTDVYSLGATLYELLTLRPMFEGVSREEVLRRIAFDEPAPPRRLNRAIPVELETIVLKALEKNPAERYQAAQELADDLGRFLKDEPIKARRPSPVQRARKWARRHKPLVETAAVLLLTAAVVGGSLWVWWAQRQAEAEGEARAALREAAGLLEEERWPEALSAARRAEAVLAAVGADPGLRRQAGALIGDLEMGRRLQEARLRLTAFKDDFDGPGADAAYAAAFQEYGLDVDGLDAQAAAERVRPRPIGRQLVAALDDWAFLRRRLKAEGWRHRLAVARAADPDALRLRLRNALEGTDPKALEELAWADQIDDWPVPTLVLLGRLAHGTATGMRVAARLRRAQQRHPGDFWLNETLGLLLLEEQPPRLEEAIRYLSVAVALRPQSPGARVNLGVGLAVKGHLEEAIAEYREALRLNEDSPIAHYNLGSALRLKGHLDEAVAECREAVRLKKDDPEAHYGLGTALSEKGQLDAAVAEYREALRLKKAYPEAHYNLGNALKMKGQLGEAIAAYREAVRLKKDYPEAHHNLGDALYDKGQLDEALAEFREALQLKKDSPEDHNDLGAALSKKGQLDEALAEFREAIRLKQDFPEAHNNLGALLCDQMHDYEAAIAAFQEALRIKENYPEAHYNLGNALEMKGRLDEAIAAYREAVRLKKDYPEAHYNLGTALRHKGQPDEVIAEFREALRLKKYYPEAHNNLGNALLQKGQVDEAIAEYREALRLKKDNPEAHDNLGTALRDKGHLDAAIAEHREALRLRQDYPPAHNNLGNALHAKGQLDAAIAEYREALQLKKDFPTAHYNLGLALSEKGQLDAAITEYREALRLKPDYATAHNNLGATLHRKGQLDAAITEYREALGLRQDYPEAHSNLGTALRDKGLLDEAIAEYREALRLKKDDAEAQARLGLVLLQQGRFREAVEQLRLAHQLGSRRSGWPYPSAQWLRDAERLADLDARLPVLLKGAEQPKDAGERLAFAKLCQLHRKLYAAAARWYAEAFNAQPELADNLQSGDRYNAACAAALAGCGQGADAQALPEEERARLRQQALYWLRGDLGAWRAKLAEGTSPARAAVMKQMQHWLTDPDFAGVRGPEALGRLPEAERRRWQRLWQQVEELRRQAAAPAKAAAPAGP